MSFCILTVGLCATVRFAWENLIAKDIWTFVLIGVFGIVMFLLLVSIWTQPQSQLKAKFMVPLFPVTPGLSIIVNIYLILNLQWHSWIYFAVWMLVGVIFYFFYGISASSEEKVVKHSDKAEGEINEAFEDHEEILSTKTNRIPTITVEDATPLPSANTTPKIKEKSPASDLNEEKITAIMNGLLPASNKDEPENLIVRADETKLEHARYCGLSNSTAEVSGMLKQMELEEVPQNSLVSIAEVSEGIREMKHEGVAEDSLVNMHDVTERKQEVKSETVTAGGLVANTTKVSEKTAPEHGDVRSGVVSGDRDAVNEWGGNLLQSLDGENGVKDIGEKVKEEEGRHSESIIFTHSYENAVSTEEKKYVPLTEDTRNVEYVHEIAVTALETDVDAKPIGELETPVAELTITKDVEYTKGENTGNKDDRVSEQELQEILQTNTELLQETAARSIKQSEVELIIEDLPGKLPVLTDINESSKQKSIKPLSSSTHDEIESVKVADIKFRDSKNECLHLDWETPSNPTPTENVKKRSELSRKVSILKTFYESLDDSQNEKYKSNTKKVVQNASQVADLQDSCEREQPRPKLTRGYSFEELSPSTPDSPLAQKVGNKFTLIPVFENRGLEVVSPTITPRIESPVSFQYGKKYFDQKDKTGETTDQGIQYDENAINNHPKTEKKLGVKRDKTTHPFEMQHIGKKGRSLHLPRQKSLTEEQGSSLCSSKNNRGIEENQEKHNGLNANEVNVRNTLAPSTIVDAITEASESSSTVNVDTKQGEEMLVADGDNLQQTEEKTDAADVHFKQTGTDNSSNKLNELKSSTVKAETDPDKTDEEGRRHRSSTSSSMSRKISIVMKELELAISSVDIEEEESEDNADNSSHSSFTLPCNDTEFSVSAQNNNLLPAAEPQLNTTETAADNFKKKDLKRRLSSNTSTAGIDDLMEEFKTVLTSSASKSLKPVFNTIVRNDSNSDSSTVPQTPDSLKSARKPISNTSSAENSCSSKMCDVLGELKQAIDLKQNTPSIESDEVFFPSWIASLPSQNITSASREFKGDSSKSCLHDSDGTGDADKRTSYRNAHETIFSPIADTNNNTEKKKKQNDCNNSIQDDVLVKPQPEPDIPATVGENISGES